jgi:uncharacterized protein YbcC (UPF0753/DUF2309 family)
MLETTVAAVDTDADTVWADVVRVCNRIPPLWDLPNYVAVNPFLGFTSKPIVEAAQTIGDGLDAQVLPGLEFYRQRWKEGSFNRAILAGAATRLGQDAETLAGYLNGVYELPRRPARPMLTFAERHDQDYGTDWNDLLGRSVARWCSVYISEGGTYWGLPLAGRSLYDSWLEATRVDRSLEIAGLRGWRHWAMQLPGRSDEALTTILARLPVPPHERCAYLYRLLAGLYGWASYFRRSSWESKSDEPGAVADLLAIRLCADAAVAELARPITSLPPPAPVREVEDESVRLVFQEALEDGFVHRLLSKLSAPSPARSHSRPALQAVFCIDVRSEPLRRHLEAQAADIETLGFAGFFGVALDWHAEGGHSARCPVLLKPGVRLRSTSAPASALLRQTFKHVQTAPAASFSFVETVGLAYAGRLAGDALNAAPLAPPPDGRGPFTLVPDDHGSGLALSAQLDLAAGILKNMGLGRPHARLVLLCGHEGQSANNPHAAGLDCGACGGHGGAINARVAAALLNDPAVREGLARRGWDVPADTHFLPAVHNTSTDVVSLFDMEQLPSSHEPDLARLRNWLGQASAEVRRERAAALGLDSRRPGLLERMLRRRACDWSEVRPEWGLARNAAFIAARRVRSRAANLEGRTFLHEYDASADPDCSILTLILSAPMVVASWINLQYFASTVDNRAFGSGSKALHNRVGDAGVVLGNGGDLRTGLATQSVHASDGSWYHEPLRLQVVVEARPAKIETVLAAQPGVRELVDNGWVRLFALDPDSTTTHQRVSGAGWQRVTPVS